MATPLSALLQQAGQTPTPPPAGTPGPSAPPGPDVGALLGGLQDGILAGFKQALETSGAAMVGRGLLLLLSGLGDWLHDKIGPILGAVNVVTQRPEAWTNKLSVVVEAETGARVLASLLIVCLVGANLVQWLRSDGRSADRIANSIGGLVTAAVLIQFALPIVDQTMPAVNALLAWAAGNATDPTAAIPGWSAVGAAAAGAAPVPAGSDQPLAYEGLGKLLLAGQVVWAFQHLLQGTAWWDVLLILMPLAIAAGAWEYTASWFDRWGSAVTGSLVAQFALCLAMRIGAALVDAAAKALADGKVDQVVVNLLLGFAFMAVVTKLAAMTHAGIDVLHPFAAVRRGGSSKAAATAGSAAAGAVVPAATVAGGPAAGAVAGAAGAAAAAGGSPVPVPPPAPVPVPIPVP